MRNVKFCIKCYSTETVPGTNLCGTCLFEEEVLLQKYYKELEENEAEGSVDNDGN